MTTTILGANGKLGAILAKYAKADALGWRTVARHGSADVNWSGAFDDLAFTDVFTAGGTLINMIGQTSSEDDELQDSNVRFVQDILTAAAKRNVAHVMLMSSAAVYGAEEEGAPICEDAVLRPSSPYGISKAAMEDVARQFAIHHAGLAITILRIGNVAGADALTGVARRSIVTDTVMPLHRFADGRAAQRSYIGPRDLFDVVRKLATLHAPPDGALRIVNVAHPSPVTLDAVLRAYKTHVLPDLVWTDIAAPKNIPRNVTLDCNKLLALVKLPETDDPADELGRQVAEYLTL